LNTGVILDIGNDGIRGPFRRAVNTGSVDRRPRTRPVNTGVQNDTRVGDPGSRPVKTGITCTPSLMTAGAGADLLFPSHVTLVINPAVDCHYFLRGGPRLPSQSVGAPWPVPTGERVCERRA